MAEIDTSSYPTKNTTPNPIEQASGFVQLQNGVQTLNRQKVALQQDQFNLVKNHLDFMKSNLGSLAMKPNLTKSDFQDVAVQGIKTGAWTPEEAASILGSPMFANAQDNPDSLRPFATQMLGQVMSAENQFAQTHEPMQIDNGQTAQIGNFNRATNTFDPAGSVQKQLSPADLASPQQVGTTPQGQPLMGTQQQFLQQTSPGQLPTGAAPFSPAGGPTSPAAPNPAATAPPAPPSAPAPASAPPPLPTARPTGPIAMGMPAGRAEAMQGLGAQSAAQSTQLTQAAQQAPQQINLLNNLDSALDEFTSGPGADYQKAMESFAQRNIPGMDKLIDPTKIASQDAFHKWATQLAQSQFATLGGTGSNEQLASASATSPSELLSKAGNKEIIAFLKGQQNAIAVKDREWSDWQQQYGPETYAKFNTEFNKVYDPQVFQFAAAAPEARSDMVSKMSPKQRQAFFTKVKQARNDGWINPQGQ